MWISLQSLNDGCGGTLIEEFVLHPIHIGSYVLEELVIALTEVVETRFTISGMGETIFRTFSIASKEILTFAALTGQRLLFGLTKCLLAKYPAADQPNWQGWSRRAEYNSCRHHCAPIHRI